MEHQGYRFALYKRYGGHAPELDNPEHLEVIGRLMGRIHACGQAQTFEHRPAVNIQSYGTDSRAFLLDNDFIPTSLIPAYESVSRDMLAQIQSAFDRVQYQSVRLHGDCHVGNMLWRDEQPHFVDFDDARNGPSRKL